MKIPKNWTFENSEIAKNFNNHVNEQLPWYQLAGGVVQHIARHYITNESTVYDIGASNGNIGRLISETLKVRGARLISIEKSKEMAATFKAPGEIITADATGHTYKPASFVVCFLSLIFMAPDKRTALLARLVESAKQGSGAVCIVEKFQQPAGYVSTIIQRLTTAGKVASGVPAADIIQKELSLQGVQRPLSRKQIERLGGKEVFRFGEFSCYIIDCETYGKK